MRNFVYFYEGAFLQRLREYLPSLKDIICTDKETMLTATVPIKRFPFAYYSRTSEKWSLPRTYSFVLPNSSGVPERYKACMVEQHYTMKIFTESAYDALSLAAIIKNSWNHYLEVPWSFNKYYFYHEDAAPTINIRVGLYLLGVTVGEDRSPDNKIGSQRYVQIDWTSQMPMPYTANAVDSDDTLVEEVRFFVNQTEFVIHHHEDPDLGDFADYIVTADDLPATD